MNMKEQRLLDLLLRALVMALSSTRASLPAVLKGRITYFEKKTETQSCRTMKSDKGRD